MNQWSMNTAPEKRRNVRDSKYKNIEASSFPRGEKTNCQDTHESEGDGSRYLPREKIHAEGFHQAEGEQARRSSFRKGTAMYDKQALLPLAKISIYSCCTKEQAGR
jgi:hypothetical protein